MSDQINHPNHYTFGDIECIDAIRASLGFDGFLNYCQGNAIKYLWRWEHKGGRQRSQESHLVYRTHGERRRGKRQETTLRT